MSSFYDEEIENEFDYNFEDEDIIQCPYCFGYTAIIIQSEFQGEVCICQDCKFKWKELLEPNHLFVKFKDKNLMTVEDLTNNKDMELEYIGDNANIFDICDEDYERYELIIKFSNLRLQNHLPEIEKNFIWKKQKKYFDNKNVNKSEKEYKENRENLHSFILEPKSVNIKSVLYVLEHHCGIPGFKIKNDSYVDTETISCKGFNINALKGFGIDIDNLEKSLNEVNIKLIKFDNYNLYSEEEINILNGVNEVNKVNKVEKLISIKKEQEQEQKQKSEKNIIQKEKTKEANTEVESFFQRETTYGVNIETLYKEIEDCKPLGTFVTSKPFIMELDEYYSEYLKYYTNWPSLIDYDNKIVFINISHKEIIEILLENHFASDLQYCSDFDSMEELFHQKINSTQIFVNSRNRDKENPLMLTNSNKISFLREKFLEILKNGNIKYNLIYTKNDESNTELTEDFFVVLNQVSNMVEGEVYFPKSNEENIPEGRILVIPTATEEYFLPSLSSMNGNGCIITEKGSKTSHIVLMSKEFNFNIILVEKASEKFKDGDNLIINLDDLIIYKK